MWTKLLWLIKANWKTTLAGWITGALFYVLTTWFGMPLTEEQKLGIAGFIVVLGTFIPDGTTDPLEHKEK